MLISTIWYFFKHKIRTVYTELKYGKYTLGENTNTYSANFSWGDAGGKNSFNELVPDSADSSRLDKIKGFSKNYEKGGTEVLDQRANEGQVIMTSRGSTSALVQPKKTPDESLNSISQEGKGREVFTVEESNDRYFPGGGKPELSSNRSSEAIYITNDDLTVPLTVNLEDDLTLPLTSSLISTIVDTGVKNSDNNFNNELTMSLSDLNNEFVQDRELTAPLSTETEEELTAPLSSDLEDSLSRLSQHSAFTIDDEEPENKPKRDYKRENKIRQQRLNNFSYQDFERNDPADDEVTVFLSEEDEEYFEDIQNQIYDEMDEIDRKYEEDLEEIEQEYQERSEKLEREMREWEEEQDYLFWHGY